MMAIAILVLSSCAKRESDTIEMPSQKECIIHAVINEADVKTSYEENGSVASFSWVSGDVMKLIVYSAEDGSANQNSFWAQASGPKVDFSGSLSDGYPTSGFAVYPSSIATGGVKDAYTITLPAEYTVSGNDFSAVKVPLIGTVDPTEELTYHFKTAVGVLKINLSNVPVAARKLVLTSSADNLSGVFDLDATAAANGLLMSACTGSEGHSITVNFPQQTAGSTISVYLPVPVGTISAGATLEVQQSDGTPIKTTAATTQPITVGRGQLIPIAGAISVEEWETLGTGKFMDDHGFYYLYGPDGRSASDYVDVTVQRHSTETNRYRITAPYATCCDYAYYWIPNSAAYIYIDVRPDLGTDMVVNHSYKYNDGTSNMFDGCYWGYSANYFNSRIIARDGEGAPTNIQLAVNYFTFAGDYSAANCAENPKIEVVFPGATPMLADVFNYANGASASYSKGKVNVTINNATITSVKVKVTQAASEAAAINAGVTALLAGEEDLTFTETGSQALALADGSYYLVYMVETEGHGYTFKRTAFELPTEITLTAEMISACNVCSHDGTGVPALVDNDATTYWHSDWYYAVTTNDPVYGIFFDIALTSEISQAQFKYQVRSQNANSRPTHVVYGVSDDGTNWTKLEAEAATEEMQDATAGTWVTLPMIDLGGSYKYLRFGISDSADTNDGSLTGDLNFVGYKKCTNLAALKLFSY